MEDTIDEIYECLKDYPDLIQQYKFYNCLIISSDEIYTHYDEAQRKYKNNLRNIEIYYCAQIIYTIKIKRIHYLI